MFRNMTAERHLSSGPSPSHSAGLGVASSGYGSQENSWISLLSVLSRPVLSIVQKYLPDPSVWFSRDEKMNLVKEQSTLRQLEEMGPVGDLGLQRCESDGAAGLRELTAGPGFPWLPADSLKELGIEKSDGKLSQQTQIGYLTTAGASPSQVWLRTEDRRQSKMWWGSFWNSEDSPQSSEGLWTQPLEETKSQTAAAFVQNNSEGWTLGENTGQCDHKDKSSNKGHLHTEQHPSPSVHLRRCGAAAPCSEVALTTPDQDNGYFSLEEEQLHVCRLYVVKAPSEETPARDGGSAMQTEMDEEDESTAETEEAADRQEVSDSQGSNDEAEQEVVTEEGVSTTGAPTTPHCDNKTIAYIMGCPCSDDDQSESSSDDDDDDDGFDSECSSELSVSADEDDDDASDSDSETELELERLWSSYQSHDPYNPQNFTACVRTCTTAPRPVPTTAPRPVPTTTAPSSIQPTLTSSHDVTPLDCSSSLAESPPVLSSPPESQDGWDESTSASETDEAESLRIWSSFSCTSDLYSPLNFQAAVRTQSSAKVGGKVLETPPHPPCHDAMLPPRYRKEGAEDRLDSGFSETHSSTGGAVVIKKVRFCEQVEEFFASCGEEEEDRRGPWEELARDRCRFLRRCQEVEQSIAFCLQPQHRRRVLWRLNAARGQDSLGRHATASAALSEDTAPSEAHGGYSAR